MTLFTQDKIQHNSWTISAPLSKDVCYAGRVDYSLKGLLYKVFLSVPVFNYYALSGLRDDTTHANLSL